MKQTTNTAKQVTQTKKQSINETTINIVIGFIISWILSIVLLQFNYFHQNTALSSFIWTLNFAVVSYIRAYLLRRFFNKKNGTNQSKKQSALEISLNISVGFMSSYILIMIILDYEFFRNPAMFNTFIMNVIFTVVSFARIYLLRRLFNYINHHQPHQPHQPN